MCIINSNFCVNVRAWLTPLYSNGHIIIHIHVCMYVVHVVGFFCRTDIALSGVIVGTYEP